MRKHFLSGAILGAVVMSVALFSQPAAVLAQGPTTVPVYRFYYHATWEGAHLYRTVPNAPGAGWDTEGMVFYISPVQLPYTVPLYVVYSQKLQDHLYTVDIGARDHSLKFGYVDQGVFGYVLAPNKDLPGTAPLYRWVRSYTVMPPQGLGYVFLDHFYQVSASPVTDYKSEGIECHVWTEPLKLPQRLLELYAPAAGTTLHQNDTATISWKVWSGEGYLRLSYSADNGASWHAIATVANKGNYGDINNQSYNWKMPTEAVGKIRIKVDWVKESNGSKLPWATETSGVLTVLHSGIRVQRPDLRKP